MASNPTFNAADFGAWSNSTLNTAGINGAIAEAHNNGGGIVTITGPNVITVNAAITLYSNVVLHIDGCTVQRDAAFTGSLFTGTSLGHVEFRGNGVLDNNNSSSALISLTSCTDVLINVPVTNYSGTAPIVLTTCTRFGVGRMGAIEAVLLGAKGDGATDDQNAIQTALNLAKSAVSSNGGGFPVFLEAAVYVIGSQLLIPAQVRLRGYGRATQIKAKATFTALTPMIRLGEGVNATIMNTRLEDVYVNCNDVALGGVYSDEANEQSGLTNVAIGSFINSGNTFGYGVRLHNNGTSVAAHGYYENVECYPSASATDDKTYGFWHDNVGSWNTLVRYTTGSNSLTNHGLYGVYVNGTGTGDGGMTIIGYHLERMTDGVYVDGSAHCSIVDAEAVSGTNLITNLVHANTTGVVSALMLRRGTATNIAKDDKSTTTWTDTALPLWMNNAASMITQGLKVVGAATVSGDVGFYGATAQTKQTVTGAKGGNAALGSLLTALSTLGLITDSSSA